MTKSLFLLTEYDISKYGISVNLGSIFTKIINLIYLLDFSTIYKSIFIGIDPFPVKSINYIKKNINV